MNIGVKIIKLFASLLLFVVVGLLGAYLTGRTPRAYDVLLSDKEIVLSGKRLIIEDLARTYQPQMHLRATTPSPPLLWVWYEVIDRQDSYDLVYYYNWENEINPNSTVDKYYAAFRAAYFGYPLYDIEYFQVNVNKASDLVDKIKFETSEKDDFNQIVVEHIIADVERIDSLTFRKIESRKNGEVINNTRMQPVFEGKHILAGAMTWNHLSCLIDQSLEDRYTLRVDTNSPLKFLSAKDYANYKFARKSQGDHQTKENKTQSLLTVFVLLLLALLPVFLLSKLKTKTLPK